MLDSLIVILSSNGFLSVSVLPLADFDDFEVTAVRMALVATKVGLAAVAKLWRWFYRDQKLTDFLFCNSGKPFSSVRTRVYEPSSGYG